MYGRRDGWVRAARTEDSPYPYAAGALEATSSSCIPVYSFSHSLVFAAFVSELRANAAHAHLWRGYYAFAVQQPNALVALAGALGDGPLPGLRPTAPSPHHQRALVLRNANSRAVVSPRTHRLRAWSVRLSEL